MREFVRVVSVEGGFSWEKLRGEEVIDRGATFATEEDAKAGAIEVNGAEALEEGGTVAGEENIAAQAGVGLDQTAAAGSDTAVIKKYRFLKDYVVTDGASYATGQEVELNEIQGAAFVTDEIAEEIA